MCRPQINPVIADQRTARLSVPATFVGCVPLANGGLPEAGTVELVHLFRQLPVIPGVAIDCTVAMSYIQWDSESARWVG